MWLRGTAWGIMQARVKVVTRVIATDWHGLV